MPRARKPVKPTMKPSARPEKPKRRVALDENHTGDMGEFQLKDEDPGMKYVWANVGGNGVHSRSAYEAVGYKVVTAVKGGVAPKLGAVKANTEVLRQDFILMELVAWDNKAKYDHASLTEYGRTGQTGQDMLDRREVTLREGEVSGRSLRAPDGMTITPEISGISQIG